VEFGTTTKKRENKKGATPWAECGWGRLGSICDQGEEKGGSIESPGEGSGRHRRLENLPKSMGNVDQDRKKLIEKHPSHQGCQRNELGGYPYRPSLFSRGIGGYNTNRKKNWDYSPTPLS